MPQDPLPFLRSTHKSSPARELRVPLEPGPRKEQPTSCLTSLHLLPFSSAKVFCKPVSSGVTAQEPKTSPRQASICLASSRYQSDLGTPIRHTDLPAHRLKPLLSRQPQPWTLDPSWTLLPCKRGSSKYAEAAPGLTNPQPPIGWNGGSRHVVKEKKSAPNNEGEGGREAERRRQSERARMSRQTPFSTKQNQKSNRDLVQPGGQRATRESREVT